MKIFKTLIIVLLVYTSCFSANPPKQKFSIVFPQAEILNEYTARIPLKNFGQLIVIEARLLGKTGNFIIDTGSETMILNSKHYSTNPRNKTNNKYGVDGRVGVTLKKNLESFNIGGLIWNNKNSDVIDLSHIEESKKMKLLGIIGYNFLKDYEIFVDLYLNQITMTKVDKNGNRYDDKVYLEKVSDSLEFNLRKHGIILETEVNNKDYRFCLDTGAEYNQINKKFVKRNPDQFHMVRKINLTGTGGRSFEVMVGLMKYLNIKSQKFSPMNTMMTNLSNSYEIFGSTVDGVLGYEFFKQRRTIINYQKETLYFVNFPN